MEMTSRTPQKLRAIMFYLWTTKLWDPTDKAHEKKDPNSQHKIFSLYSVRWGMLRMVHPILAPSFVLCIKFC